MKLDLVSIRKLSPAGLWDLAELSALISTLMAVVAGRFGGDASVRRCGHMVIKYQRQLDERRLENFNMRVKAWVMQCPARIAHVRGVIGEATIRRWSKNRMLDYAFTEKFGDWKAMFPHGLGELERNDKHPHRQPASKAECGIRSYTRKPFALFKIPNVERILYGQARPDPAQDTEQEQRRAAALKLWGVDITNAKTPHPPTQPRTQNTVKPVRFHPNELVPEAAIGKPENMLETAEPEKLTSPEKLRNAAPKIFPPPKPDHEAEQTQLVLTDPKPP